MSWPQWSAATQPSVPPVINPATPVINSAPAVVPPGLQYTPEQYAQLQQQNWNQWAQWQQQYQQWHQQYGAEVFVFFQSELSPHFSHFSIRNL